MVTIKGIHTLRHKHRLHMHILLSRHDPHKSMITIKIYTRHFSVDVTRTKAWSPLREHTNTDYTCTYFSVDMSHTKAWLP